MRIASAFATRWCFVAARGPLPSGDCVTVSRLNRRSGLAKNECDVGAGGEPGGWRRAGDAQAVGLGGEASLKMPIDLRARVRDIKRKTTSQDTPPSFLPRWTTK